MLAELTLQDGELMLEQQDLRRAPGRIPTRDPGRSKQAGDKEEDETQTHKSRSFRIEHGSHNPMTSMDRHLGTLGHESRQILRPLRSGAQQFGVDGTTTTPAEPSRPAACAGSA
jgi:hypothetical protein